MCCVTNKVNEATGQLIVIAGERCIGIGIIQVKQEGWSKMTLVHKIDFGRLEEWVRSGSKWCR